MLATGSVSGIIYVFGQEAFADWAWRIPFIASVILVLCALWVRGGQEESQEFIQEVAKPRPKQPKFRYLKRCVKILKRSFILLHCVWPSY